MCERKLIVAHGDIDFYRKLHELSENCNVILVTVIGSDHANEFRKVIITNIDEPPSDDSVATFKPTELEKLTAFIAQFIKSIQRPVVGINCLHRLILYNGYDRVKKFISVIRDYAILYGGGIVVELSDIFDSSFIAYVNREFNS